MTDETTQPEVSFETKYKRLLIESQEEIQQLRSKINLVEKNMQKRINESNMHLQIQITEMEQLNRFMVHRELAMVNLKKENEDLKKRLANLEAKVVAS